MSKSRAKKLNTVSESRSMGMAQGASTPPKGAKIKSQVHSDATDCSSAKNAPSMGKK